MRTLYLGTPEFAVLPLEALHTAGYDIVAVVTQPDSPARRSRELVPSPVRQAALRLGLPTLTPPTLKNPEAVESLVATRPDVAVVAAYGEILRRNVLAIPPLGFLNIHPSLLPLHRGPAPVTGAILAGDTVTGVTIMQLDPGMDSGPVLAQERVALPADARAGMLTTELFALGTELLLRVLPLYAAGELVPREQDHARATVTKLLRKEDGQIDWTLPAIQIERMVRAYDPWPSAFSSWRGQQLKLLAACALPDQPNAEPGTLLPGPAFRIATGNGILEVVTVHPAGKRPMPGPDFRRGIHEAEGRLDA